MSAAWTSRRWTSPRALRHGPTFEEGGSADRRRHRADRYGQPHGRVDLPKFKGTATWNGALDRKLSDAGLAAIDISQSGTRREEKLLSPDTLSRVTMLRRTLSTMHPVDAMSS